MKHFPWISCAFLLLLPATARAQSEAKAPAQARQAILDISLVEAEGNAAPELERSARDKKQVDGLIASGKAVLIADVEIEGEYNRPVTTHLGRRVPIQTASVPVATRGDGRSGTEPAGLAFGVPQIQYQDTGISITATPVLVGNGKVSVGLNVTLSDFNASISTLTPIFISRNINSTITIGDGQTAPILNSLERSGLTPSDRQPGRTGGQTPVRFMILVTVHSVD